LRSWFALNYPPCCESCAKLKAHDLLGNTQLAKVSVGGRHPYDENRSKMAHSKFLTLKRDLILFAVFGNHRLLRGELRRLQARLLAGRSGFGVVPGICFPFT